MSIDTKNLVAVLPDGTEYFEEIRSFSQGWRQQDYRVVCQNAVRKAGITTSRLNPAVVNVDLFVLEIKHGVLERRKINTYSVTPPLERMIDSEYHIEMKKILSEIPPEFHSYVTSESYDRGHSAGYEECVLIAQDIVYSLKPCIESYKLTCLSNK